jgi:hypothetical protein
MSAKPLALLCAVAAFTSPLAAQEHARVPGVGIGITVPDIGLLLPMNVTRHFRLEPYVSFYAARADYPVSGDTTWQSHTRIGVGFFSVAHPREGFGLYLGPRVGLLRGSTSVDGLSGQTSTTSSGWFVAGVIGGEYSPVPGLSVGGEAKIEYEHSSSSSSGSRSIGPNLFARDFYSVGALVVRFYP